MYCSAPWIQQSLVHQTTPFDLSLVLHCSSDLNASHPKYSLSHPNATNPNERQRETKITVGQIGINLSDPLPPSMCGVNEFIPNKGI
jgi:hypothetical protein